ncbi:uncharacterized protein LOC144344662 [Saccoglossus kowalevskii]
MWIFSVEPGDDGRRRTSWIVTTAPCFFFAPIQLFVICIILQTCAAQFPCDPCPGSGNIKFLTCGDESCTCILVTWACDGRIDCENGEDESAATCDGGDFFFF